MRRSTYHVILNAGAGNAGDIDAALLKERFAAVSAEAVIDGDVEKSFAGRLESARRSTADVLVAAGGDGTVTALAAIAVETGRPLVVLPLGTANLLARDLSLPLTLDEWFAAFSSFQPRRIDVGEVNGQLFLHKVVVGAMPGLAAARERVRGQGWSGKLALVAHGLRRLGRLRRFAAEIARDDGSPHIERVQSVAVANNSYDAAPGRVFARSRLDSGRLSLYLVRHLGVGDALRLATEMLLGNWRDDEVLEIEQVTSVVIRTRWRRVRAMRDGEVELMRSPLAFRIIPRALTVLAPPVVDTVPERQARAADDVPEI